MPFNCATWDTEGDGYKAGPRPAPSLAGVYKAWGQLQKEEVHASVLHVRRVHLLTYLAINGPTPTPVLARDLDWALSHIGIVLRGMKRGYVVESETVSPPAGRGAGRWPRVWRITETGRWALWRLAWLTRSAFVPAQLPWAIETGVTGDPLEAVRLHVRQEFLLPGAYVALSYLMRYEVCSRRQLACMMNVRHVDVCQRMRWWERLGWVEQAPEEVQGLPGQFTHCRQMTAAGVSAVFRHVDALRKVGLSCGWTPTPGAVQYGPGHCQYHYEEEFLEMGWSL